MSGENVESNEQIIIPSAVEENSSETVSESSNIVPTQVQSDLIDFTEENNLNVTESGDSLADQYFRRCKRRDAS